MRLLQPQWNTILQSDIRIKSAIANAAEAADRVLGIQPVTALDWVPTVIAETTELQDHDDHDVTDIDTPPPPEVLERKPEDSEEVLDDLEDEVAGMVDSDSMLEDATADMVWKLPVCGYIYIAILKLINHPRYPIL